MRKINPNLKVSLVLLFTIMFFKGAYAQFQSQADAPDAILTDLDGNTSSVHSLCEQGFIVILMIGEEAACWQTESVVGAMNPVWNLHGPDGDNKVRMFFVDNKPIADTPQELQILENFPIQPGPLVTDSIVEIYTQQEGINFPVVNYDGDIPGYEFDLGPAYFMICPDKTYHYFAGFGEFATYASVIAHISECSGADMSSDVSLGGFKYQPQFCVIGDSVKLKPVLYSTLSTAFNTTDTMITQNYDIDIYKNGQFVETQNINPYSDNDITIVDFAYLDEILVEAGDSLRFVLQYPGDSYSGNNTQTFIVPYDLEQTPTATTSELLLSMVTPSDAIGAPSFSICTYTGEGLFSYQENYGTYELELDNGICYEIQFSNQQDYAPVLKDLNNNIIISLEEFAFFPNGETPFLYFNVNNKQETGINTLDFPLESKHEIIYYNLEGKKININELSKLPKGSVYIRKSRSSNGTYSIKKNVSLK
ncbi:MAG: hypothetical protein ISR00_00200 [Flavobacteriales bacterium]|nr:hypothetical protein [Flavobacteriales bacterium]MBL6872353.1 hypothetical protein [Flavobacteriales bacterium]